jgi:hypothetical protein
VKSFTKTLAVLVLALWGLAISHCDLEDIPGLGFLACCHHPDTAPHQDDDCQSDGCAVVESGFYKVEDDTAVVPAPILVAPLAVVDLAEQAEVLSSQLPVPAALPPPELPSTWQFSSRAALSPRAPSFLS